MTVLSVLISAFNDCSTDGTAVAVRECAGMYHELILLPHNGGKGAAVIAGLRSSAPKSSTGLNRLGMAEILAVLDQRPTAAKN